ncbi:MAG: hypothetical protein A2161_13110 [Candidatus Schekmanbacteria bacterium RBG_13_48_7]|uniref:Glycosyltransferase RgtA/B/C/D-like domain-containing protein n=1 Tax=Candidatus Schekmanbacteria bacterium RBG_13_48_7 TaxID=1817878 RepID=A0A1F7RJF9_9BACT|nr:MAG: hypothetical protein A2161_13110 [Candidatus Schekmanbacteria bacterium RBG_13_48_7]
MKPDSFIPFGLFLVGFTIYLGTLCPSVFVGDSGEIAAASWFAGVPHSTGFPTYINISKLITFLPVGNIAYRLNIFSGLFGAGLLILPFYFLRKMNYPVQAGALSALLFMVVPNLWSQSVIARVYTLSNFLLFLSLFLCLSAIQKADFRYLCSGIFVFGMALNTHGGILSGIPAVFVLVFLYLAKSSRKPFHRITTIIVFGIIGFSTIIFIPVRGTQFPFPTWHFLNNAHYFWNYITHREYEFKLFSRSLPEMIVYLKTICAQLSGEWSLWLLIIAVFNLIFLCFKKPSEGIMLVLISSANIVQMLLYGSGSDMLIMRRFFIPTHLVLTISLSVFFWGTLNKLPKKAGHYMFFLVLFLPVIMFVQKYVHRNLRSCYLPYEYNSFALKQCSTNSALLHIGDNISFPIWYLHYVENSRPDVAEVSVTISDTESYSQRLRILFFGNPCEGHDILQYHSKYNSILNEFFERFDPLFATYSEGLLVPPGWNTRQEGILIVVSKSPWRVRTESSIIYPWHIPHGGWKMYMTDEDIELKQLADNVVAGYLSMIKEGLESKNNKNVYVAKNEIMKLVPPFFDK